MVKKILTMALGFLFLVLISGNVKGEEIISQENGLDVIFVLDASGSMKTNDPDRAALEMVKAFCDTVHIDNIRIGFVAYNDRIVTSASLAPVSAYEEREVLKEQLDSITYSGNTDIGLGLSYAYQFLNAEDGRDQILVFISDGETDLGGTVTGRSLAQSNQDLLQTVQACQEREIPIYTIAFGTYDGNKATLEQMSNDTKGIAFTAQSPEALIEVLYGLFSDNLSYKIQEVTDSVYAKGDQEIRYLLDEMYLDELDLLLISPQNMGETTIWYGDKQVETTSLSHYTVGKITEIDPTVKDLKVRTTTSQGQALKAYLISYRSLTPVLDIQKTAQRNERLTYSIFFRDKKGQIVADEAFYKNFQWNLSSLKASTPLLVEQEDAILQDGVIQGSITFDSSGTYQITGSLSDTLGSYSFETMLTVMNTPPSGALPKDRFHIGSETRTYDLNSYFKDNNKDTLSYSLEQGDGRLAEAYLEGNQLFITPKKSGFYSLTLFVSDGEDTLAYPYEIEIMPLWKVYWWVIAILIVITFIIVWRVLHKPKPELVQIVEKKAQCRFHGKLDAYFTKQPEEKDEIPPLTFPMYKMKVNKVSLGELMSGYPGAADALGLDEIFLIADEERRLVLYHTSHSLIMIGNSIVCRQIQYSVGFGDVIYLSSPGGNYELEVHYISMIQ